MSEARRLLRTGLLTTVVGAMVVTTVPLAAGAQPLEVVGPQSVIGCDTVRGEMVAFLVPERGIVLLGNRPFHGASAIGTVADGRLAGSLPGYGEIDLEIEGAEGAEIFGLADRSLPLEGRRGCFGFGARRFSDIDDLKTYLHWWVRSVLHPLALASEEAAPSVWLAGRVVTIEVVVAGHRPMLLRIPEGSTVGFQPTGSAQRLFFQPFVVGRAGRRAAVRVSVKEGAYFGPGVTRDVAFVAIDPDRAAPVPADPPLTVRLQALEAAVQFVN